MAQAIPYAIMAAATAAQVANSERTARKQDQQAAQGIQRQGRLQRQADERVNQQISDLEGSSSQQARAERQAQYMDTLRRNRASLEGGLTPGIGSETFRDDSARAVEGVHDFAGRSAGLLSRMDAPGMQRQDESFGYGRTATDLGMIGRESAGDRFLDELRIRAIRNNPWVDAASQAAMGYASGMGAQGGGAGGWAQPVGNGGQGVSPISGVTVRGGGTGWQGNSAFGPWGRGWGG